MSNLSLLLPVHYSNVFYDLSYEDIINTCKSGDEIDICNDKHLDWWWGKILHDINKVNQSYFDLYSLLNAALKLKQDLYIKAAMKNYKEDESNDLIRSNPTLIYDIFFQYGFITDDEGIMQTYVIKNTEWQSFYDQYSKHSIINRSKFDEIISRGYYTFDEFYNIMSDILAGEKFSAIDILNYVSLHIALPFHLHPRKHKFDSLIKKYIGLSTDDVQQKIDIDRFIALTRSYKDYILDRKLFYNLIYNTYEIQTINPTLLKYMYPINQTSEMWIFDDLKTFTTHRDAKFTTQKNLDLYKMIRLCEDNENYRDLVYDNGKIMKYLLDNITFEKDDPTVKYLSRCNLSFEHFKHFFSLLEKGEFFSACFEFIISIALNSKHTEKAMEKIRFVSEHPKLNERTILRILIMIEIKKNGYIFNPDLMIFFADDYVRKIMNKNNYKISVEYKNNEPEYKLYTEQ